MRCGLAVPNLGDYGDMGLLLDLAHRADRAGWHGVFLWDHVHYRTGRSIRMVEPWTALAAVAAARPSSSLTLGVLVTPLARRRPWVLARQIATVAQLAPGRVVCGAGLGTPADAEFGAFGEPTGDAERAVRLDEALTVLRSLLDGAAVSFAGSSLQVDGVQFPAVVPRVPVWIAGRWPNRRPLRRAAGHDGVYLEKLGGSWLEPSEVAAAVEFARAMGAAESFEVVVPGITDRRDVAMLDEYATAGATWWLEHLGPKRGTVDEVLARVDAGPAGTAH